MITSLLKWFDKLIIRWGCKKYGHCGVKTIETYETTTQIKNFLLLGKKIILVRPYKQYRVSGKHKCTACGTVFTGVIVKDECLHDTRHGV